jgi:hypothetical protein
LRCNMDHADVAFINITRGFTYSELNIEHIP